MGFGSLLGGAAGFFLGGPAGAALGMGLGGAAEEALGSRGSETGAIREASQAQADASNRAADLQYQQFRESVALQEPWRQAGLVGLNKLIPEATQYTPFGMAQFQADPGYAFRLSEGQKALERSAAARGDLLSGTTGKALTRYGQEMGSQEYTNAFNRYQAEREARLNPLQSLAGVGQTVSGRLGDAASALGRNVGGLYADQGTNTANALLAMQRSRGSSYGQLGSALSKYLRTPAVGGFGGAGINPASGEYYGSLEF